MRSVHPEVSEGEFDMDNTKIESSAELKTLIQWAARHGRPEYTTDVEAVMLEGGQSAGNAKALQWFAWEMYHARQMGFLRANPAETDAEFAKRPGKTFVNLTRLVVDILAGVYKKPPGRSIEGSQALVELIQRLWAEAGLDRTMLAADRYAKLQGICAIRPVVSDGAFSLQIYPAHALSVMPHPAKPWEPLAVCARNGNAVHLWTPTRFVLICQGIVEKVIAHGYGRIPLVFLRDQLSPTSFMPPAQGADIAFQNLGINELLSDLGYIVKMQGFGVLEVVNPDINQELALSPGRAIRFQVVGDEPFGINFKNPGAPIAELIENVRFAIQRMLLAFRIPETAITVNMTSAPSGVAISASQTPLMEGIAERSEMFRPIERDLLDCMLRVASADMGLEPGLQADIEKRQWRLNVDFHRPELALSSSEKIARLRFELEQGITTPWEIMFREDPDAFASLEDARKRYFENRQAMRQSEDPGSPDDQGLTSS